MSFFFLLLYCHLIHLAREVLVIYDGDRQAVSLNWGSGEELGYDGLSFAPRGITVVGRGYGTAAARGTPTHSWWLCVLIEDAILPAGHFPIPPEFAPRPVSMRSDAMPHIGLSWWRVVRLARDVCNRHRLSRQWWLNRMDAWWHWPSELQEWLVNEMDFLYSQSEARARRGDLTAAFEAWSVELMNARMEIDRGLMRRATRSINLRPVVPSPEPDSSEASNPISSPSPQPPPQIPDGERPRTVSQATTEAGAVR